MSLSCLESDDDFLPFGTAKERPVWAEQEKLDVLLEGLDDMERDAIDAYVAETEPIECVAERYDLEVSDVVVIARKVLDRLRNETIGLKQFSLDLGVA
jgi:hypothetical protein